MAYQIKISSAGESITSASVGRWHKSDGEKVRKGETLVTIETDKVSSDLEAEEDGALKILVPEGEDVEIGAVIAEVREVPESGDSTPEAPPSEAPAGSGQPRAEAAAKDEPEATIDKGEEPERQRGWDETGKPAEDGKPDPGGRHLRPDLTVVPETAPRPEPRTVSEGRTTRTRMSPLRRKIATQLVNAQQTAAILTTFNEADLSSVIEMRKRLQDDFVERHGVKLGFMSFFVKASVRALKDVPMLNARMDGEDLVENNYYDIGIAVGTERGLVVPVIRDADRKSFAELEKDVLGYAQRARDGKIHLEDLQGGTFTITNGGVYGSLLSTPILNPPQSGILGMHTIQQRPVAVDGEVEIRPMMYLALSYDHRVVDGRDAVTFLIRVKESIENPASLVMDL